MKRLAVVLALLAAAPAFASPPLTMKKARSVARHVRHLDAIGNYDVEGWMGGPVHFGPLSCHRQTGRIVICGYNVTRSDEDGRPGQLRCRRRVTVQLRVGATEPTSAGRLVDCRQSGA